VSRPLLDLTQAFWAVVDSFDPRQHLQSVGEMMQIALGAGRSASTMMIVDPLGSTAQQALRCTDITTTDSA